MGFLGISLQLWPAIAVISIGVAYTLISVLLQRRLSNPKRMREVQARLRAMTGEMNALARNNASKEEIAAKNRELIPLMKESMNNSMKPMLVVLPLFLILYYVLLPSIPAALGPTKSVQLTFFLTSLVLGLISSVVILFYDKVQTRKEQAQQQQVEPVGVKVQV